MTAATTTITIEHLLRGQQTLTKDLARLALQSRAVSRFRARVSFVARLQGQLRLDSLGRSSPIGSSLSRSRLCSRDSEEESEFAKQVEKRRIILTWRNASLNKFHMEMQPSLWEEKFHSSRYRSDRFSTKKKGITKIKEEKLIRKCARVREHG